MSRHMTLWLFVGGFGLAALVILSGPAPPSVPVAPEPSRTGIASSTCAPAILDQLDGLNREPTARARITWAACGSTGMTAGLRALDGRTMTWEASEGSEVLRMRLARGR